MSYEQTLPHVTATFFNNFKFYKKQAILTLIHAIPEETYGSLPPGLTEKKAQEAVQGSNGTKLSTSEVARMNKSPPAKALLLGDTRKAQAIADFLNETFNRVMIPIEDMNHNNCLYEAWLIQISNSDFVFDNETGEKYGPGDLRNNLLHEMAVEYEKYFPHVMIHLDCSYKEWMIHQLDPNTESDLVTACGLRIMFNVST